jgi:hypothetical protein
LEHQRVALVTNLDALRQGEYSKMPLSETDCEDLAEYRFGDPEPVIAEAEKLML